MEHTGGILQQMKDAKPHKTLSKEEIIQKLKEVSENMDKQIPPERRLLMGANEYEKYKSNPQGYIADFCNSVWL